jgi:large subunit ribosomal protein L1
MGKIRVKTLGDEEKEKKQQKEAEKRAEAKRTEKAEEKSAEVPVAKEAAPEKPAKKQQAAAKTQARSAKYKEVATLVDRTKVYKLKDALEVLPKLQRAKFDETVELHLNTTGTGISGQVTLPHGTGKQIRVAIADDALIAEVEKGTINFDILIAEPAMMPKLARVAKFLGPRGLMPNPKNGTVSPNPTEVAKKYEGGAMNFKTEAKFPVLHLTVGKVSFGEEKLSDNVKALIKAVKTSNIKNATLKSTMSPGIKIDVSSI